MANTAFTVLVGKHEEEGRFGISKLNFGEYFEEMDPKKHMDRDWLRLAQKIRKDQWK